MRFVILLAAVATASVACTDLSGLAGGGDDLKTSADAPKTNTSPSAGNSGDAGGPHGQPDALLCNNGKIACDGTTCFDVTSDPLNCGRCAHSCLGGTCNAGACQPITLASNLNIPQGIALGPDGFVYVTEWGAPAIVRVLKKGGRLEIITSNTTEPGSIAVAGSANHVTSIIWGEQSGSLSNIAMCSSGVPCTSVNKTHVGSDIGDLAIAGDSVYFATSSSSTTGSIQSCDLTGCGGGAFMRVANQPGVQGLAINGEQLLFATNTDNGVVRRATTAGTGITDLITNLDGAAGLATDGTSLFAAVTLSGIIARCPLIGCTSPAESTMAVATYPHAVATDGVNVYWTNGLAEGKGSLSWCNVKGCSAGSGNLLASAQDNPYGIAVDEEAIYWANSAPNGSIMKIAKP